MRQRELPQPHQQHEQCSQSKFPDFLLDFPDILWFSAVVTNSLTIPGFSDILGFGSHCTNHHRRIDRIKNTYLSFLAEGLYWGLRRKAVCEGQTLAALIIELTRGGGQLFELLSLINVCWSFLQVSFLIWESLVSRSTEGNEGSEHCSTRFLASQMISASSSELENSEMIRKSNLEF